MTIEIIPYIAGLLVGGLVSMLLTRWLGDEVEISFVVGALDPDV